jgi:TPR repeat protein
MASRDPSPVAARTNSPPFVHISVAALRAAHFINSFVAGWKHVNVFRRAFVMKGIVTVLACLCCFVFRAAASDLGTNVRSELSGKAEALLQSGQFAALDSTARDLQQTNARYPGGDPQIYTFYEALGAISDGSCGCAKGTVPFAVKQEQAAKWLTADPASPPAHLAMAMLWINYAWAARGGNYASAVSQESFNDYHDRLVTANGYVANVDPTHNLFLYYERTDLAEITPQPKDTILAAFDAAVRADPAWFPIYTRKAEMLKEKWYGEPGELVRFAKSLLHAPGADIGQSAYAEIATEFVGGIAYNDGFEAFGDDWPALKRAYSAKEKNYGLSGDDSDALLQYAEIFHDQVAIADALKQMRAYAGQGYAYDMNNLGLAYQKGTGMPPQPDLAIAWYRKAADRGYSISQYNLGSIFENAPGGGPEALKWYTLAAAQGDSVATNNMGFMFENGKGVTQDYSRAAQFYEKAAAAGDMRGEYHLGTLYDRGLGVAKDDRLAMQWMIKAAQSGDHDARSWLLAHAVPEPRHDRSI